MKVTTLHFLTALFLLSAALYGQTYTLTDLGVLPGAQSGVGRGMNNLGWVAGWCGSRAFLWTPQNGMTELPAYAGRTFHAAYDVNDSGVVVGTSGLEVSGPNALRAVRWRDGTVQNLGVLGAGAFSAAHGINERGWITGWSYVGPNTTDGQQPFFYSDSSGMVSILPGSTQLGYGHDINWWGQITGYNNVQAFVWDPIAGFQDLGTPPTFTFDYTFAINVNGVVVGGTATASGNTERFARHVPGTGWQVLGGVGEHNQLWGVNSAGVAVGFQDSPPVAFRWTESDGLQILDSLIENRGPWHMLRVFDVNESGQITGHAINNVNGNNHPVLLTPVSGDDPPSAIEDLTIAPVAEGTSVRLLWAPSEGAEMYRVHRGDSPDFIPGPENLLMSTADSTAILPAADLKSFYQVIAVSTAP